MIRMGLHNSKGKELVSVKIKRGKDEITVHLRDTFEAQLPIVAAILAMGEEELDFQQVAQDAIAICVALEEELS